MSKNDAIALLERDLESRGKPSELWQALQALKPALRAVKPFVPSPGPKRHFGQWTDAVQESAYLDTFGERGSDARQAQAERLASLPNLPQFNHEWMPVTRGKLLSLQAVSSMASTTFVEVEEQVLLAA